MKAIVSVRGHVDQDTLLILDLESETIARQVEIPGLTPDSVPRGKRGISGLRGYGGKLYVATWDRISVLDGEFRVLRTYTDRRFSDLHGIHVDDESLWVTSTNIDGVYRISDHEVHPFWHAWESRSMGPTASLQADRDYRGLEKRDTGLHRWHVNGVLVTAEYVFVTFLGGPTRASRLRHALDRRGILRRKRRDGGLVVLDRHTKKVRHRMRLEGLHDAVRGGPDLMLCTQYYGATLTRVRTDSLDVDHIPLRPEIESDCQYLTRGVMPVEDGYWVGHAVHGGWELETPIARVRKYSREGKWTGAEVRLPGFVGPYDIIPYSPE